MFSMRDVDIEGCLSCDEKKMERQWEPRILQYPSVRIENSTL